MNKEQFDKKRKQLQDEYVEQALIRDKAIRKLMSIIKRIHKLEDKYFEEHPEELEDE